MTTLGVEMAKKPVVNSKTGVFPGHACLCGFRESLMCRFIHCRGRRPSREFELFPLR